MSAKKIRDAFYGLLILMIAGSVVTGVWLSSGCTGKADWNVLLITLDTTRADRLRCYGYNNVETPTLNSMARDGLLFDNAYSQIPLTLPAHTSILTGTHPNFHGVRDNGAYRVRDDLVTLAEVLKDHGYSTAAFISAAVLKKIFNLNQGFDHWDEEDLEEQSEDSPLVADRSGDKTTDAMLNWLDGHKEEKWFIWLHYYDPHQAYRPPSPYSELYAQDMYAGEIAFMDTQIRRVFERLDETGMMDRTIIIAVGDHGEGLNEHDEQTHAMLIYNTTQWIPLLMLVPNLTKPGRSIPQPVSQVDIMPTVLELLGLPAPKDVQGQSLKPLIAGKEKDFQQRDVYMESRYLFLHFGWAEQVGMVTPRYKYIRTPKPEIYDLEDDPHELYNISEESPKLLKELEFRLNEMEKKYTFAHLEELEEVDVEVELDEDTRAQLAALGYIGDQVEIDEESANRKDPKDYRHLLRLYMLLNQFFFRGDFQNLLDTTDKILEDDPEFIVAIRMKGIALFGLGRNEEAIEWYEHSLEILKGNKFAHSQIGQVYLRLEQYEKAREYLEKAVEINERDYEALYYLGRIYLNDGNREKAYEIFQSEGMKETALGHLGTAKYHEFSGRPGRAEAEYDAALEINEELSALHIEYAAFLYDRGEYKRAREHLERALEEDPSVRHDLKFQDYYERTEEYSGENIEEGDQEESQENILDLLNPEYMK